MSLINKLFGKTPASTKVTAGKKKEEKPVAASVEEKKPVGFPVKKKIDSAVLISPHTAEKAIAGQKLNQYVFKVGSRTNKIAVAKEVSKTYNVKVVNVNIINIPKKARRVGKTSGFKTGYKKAVVTLAPGQTIEAAK